MSGTVVEVVNLLLHVLGKFLQPLPNLFHQRVYPLHYQPHYT